MNDIEFLNRAYANPNDTSEDFQQAITEKPERNVLLHRILDNEQTLQDALNIEVPDHLSEKILLAQSTQRRQTFRFKLSPLKTLGLAASVLLSVGLIFNAQVSPNLSDEVLSHVYEELPHLNEQHTFSHTDIESLLASVDIHLQDSIGEVHYAGRCNISDAPGIHLVVSGRAGPVTVLILPNREITQRLEIEDVRFHGTMVPLHQGSMAIIGESDELLEPIKQRILDALIWKT